MADGERGESLRYLTTIAGVIAVLALVGCGALTLLPRQNDPAPTRLTTMRDLAAAYGRVQPGLTRASQLARLGFDPASASAQALSYLGVMERIMPRDSVRFDRLDAAVQDCIAARDHCTALVFRPLRRSYAPGRNIILTAFGLGAAAAGTDQPPEVTLLVRDGRVAFKMISGMPTAQVQRHIETVSMPRNSSVLMPAAYRVFN
jgi:hypothetical protein